MGSAGISIVLTQKAECCLVDWIPVDSRLCAVRLTTSVKVSYECEVSRYHSIVSAYAFKPLAMNLRRTISMTH